MKRFHSASRARYSLLTLGLLALGSLTACSLEEEPYSSFNTDTLYTTAGGAELGLVSAYSPLNSLYYGPAALLASDFSADQTYPRAVVGRNTLTLFNYDAGYTTQKSFDRLNESPQYIWQSCYQGIEKANQVLDRVPAATMDAARKHTILAEARFLRAFYYWLLTKNFGDVVVKTSASVTVETAVVGKSPRADVYKQIFADLDVAVAGLPSGPGAVRKGSPSKEAALALYAKAALYAGNYAVALDKAQQVIASGKYSLLPNVYDVYDVNKEDAARVENIWAYEGERAAIAGAGSSTYTYATGLYGPANSAAPAYGKSTFGSVFAYQAFYDSFAADDQRRTLLATSYVNAAGVTVPQAGITPITTQGVLVRKYQDANSIGAQSNSNVPILRLADVYLIAAEAEARATGPSATAYANVNAVRTRAGLPGLATGLSQSAFIDAVLQERSWELFGEGDRWYDLTRTDKFLTVIPLAVNSVYPMRTPQVKHKYFPIPQDEINANPQLTQNTGW
jgi:hypothetical protein